MDVQIPSTSTFRGVSQYSHANADATTKAKQIKSRSGMHNSQEDRKVPKLN